MRERLTLVTDFAELRAGMIVVIKPCDWCGLVHRGIIAKKVNQRPTLCADSGRVEPASGWGVLPAPPCSSVPFLIADDDPMENVFRVEDGMEDADARETSKPTRQPKTVRA